MFQLGQELAEDLTEPKVRLGHKTWTGEARGKSFRRLSHLHLAKHAYMEQGKYVYKTVYMDRPTRLGLVRFQRPKDHRRAPKGRAWEDACMTIFTTIEPKGYNVYAVMRLWGLKGRLSLIMYVSPCAWYIC